MISMAPKLVEELVDFHTDLEERTHVKHLDIKMNIDKTIPYESDYPIMACTTPTGTRLPLTVCMHNTSVTTAMARLTYPMGLIGCWPHASSPMLCMVCSLIYIYIDSAIPESAEKLCERCMQSYRFTGIPRTCEWPSCAA